jgi:protein O-GlcNAc transferase
MPETTIQEVLDSAIKHHQAGRLSEAEATYQQVLTLQPNHADTLHLLGVLMGQMGRCQAAVELINRAIVINPTAAGFHNNMGNALSGIGRMDQAIIAYRRAIELKPDYEGACYNLGVALEACGRYNEALDTYQRVIKIKPDYAAAYNRMGNVLGMLNRVDQAIDAYRQAIKLKPDFAVAQSNLILFMHYQPDCDARIIYEETLRWNRQHAQPLGGLIRPFTNDRNLDRRLKIGYVSPDFRTHPVAFFIENLLKEHNSNQVKIFCYVHLPQPDHTSARLLRLSSHWRNITEIKDEKVAEMIRQDRIDILVDLSGHTSSNRLLVFARRAAPVQVSYLGYPDSTGLNTMDYRFTDAFADPPEMTDGFYTERLVRLENTFLCYRPEENSPAVGPLPAVKKSGHIRLGSFNRLAKFSDSAIDLWSQILRRLPESRMLIKSLGLSDEATRRRLTERFAAGGISADRLDLREGTASLTEHLELYNQIDIALDTFPYNGTTTTCEALWMGVPVVTLAGQMHMSRVGVSLLSNVGLQELIAQTPEQYVEIAVKLAGDLPRLTELRTTLRQRMQASLLMDAKRFANNIESAYRDMWRRYCTGAD